VIETFRRVMDQGVEADITELVAGAQGLMCGFAVRPRRRGDPPSERVLFHVYRVRDDKIVEIQPFDDRKAAAMAAGIGSGCG
jgi:ketosteroid isomerase-like protein